MDPTAVNFDAIWKANALWEAQTMRDRINTQNREAFLQSSAFWLSYAKEMQATGAPIPPKPEPPVLYVVELDSDGLASWRPSPAGFVVALPLPDLPPVPAAPPPGQVRIGQPISGTAGGYRAMPDDTAVGGTLVVDPQPPESLVLLKGTFRKFINPFGGVWFRIS